MVQFLLKSGSILLLLAPAATWARPRVKTPAAATDAPYLEMDGGRRLQFERSFQSEREVKTKRGFWTKMIDFAAGAPDYRSLVRPYSLVSDSRERIILTDPGASGVHIFDFAQQKYKFISHRDGKDEMRAPMCVAVDKQDNIWVANRGAWPVMEFDRNGKLLQAWRIGQHEVVRQKDRKRIVANERSGAPDGMTETQRHLLTHGCDGARLNRRIAQGGERLLLVTLAQGVFQLERDVEMFDKRGLPAPRHHTELLNPRCASFFHRILDERFVHHRQHFLGSCFGSR